jgi:hypothetical protein
MTKVNRIHSQRSAAALKPQPQTTAADSPKKRCLSVHFPTSVLALIASAAAERGESCQHFITDAVRAKVQAVKDDRQLGAAAQRGNPLAPRAPRQIGFHYATQPQEWKLVSLRECPVDNLLCDAPSLVAAYWRKHVPTHPYFNPDCECLVAVMLDIRRRVKGHYMIGIGSVDSAIVHPRELYRVAVLACASGVVLVHNHPTGDPTPSANDIASTLRLIHAGETIQIPLLDHLIMGKRDYISLRTMGYF